MLATLTRLSALLLAMLLVVACGDDDDNRQPGPCLTCADTGVPPDGGNSNNPDAGDCPDGETLQGGECVPEDEANPYYGICQIEDVPPCGGDLVGVWNYEDSCQLENPANPYESSCGEGVTSVHWYYFSYDGTITFEDGGAYRSSFNTTTHSTSLMDVSCGGYNECGRLGQSWGLGTCVPHDTNAQLCSCEDPGTTSTETDSFDGTYTVDGNTVLFDGDNEASPYCVQGDTLYLRRNDVDTFEPLQFKRAQ